MATIKTNVNCLEKNYQIPEPDPVVRESGNLWRKSNIERKVLPYQLHHIQHHSEHSSPYLSTFNDQNIEAFKNGEEPASHPYNPTEWRKQPKSTVKFPIIQNRFGKNATEIDYVATEALVDEEIIEKAESNLQIKKSTQYPSRNPFKENKGDARSFEKVESFLKFIQIKQMRPEDKSLPKADDILTQDTKIIKGSKTLLLTSKPLENEQLKKIKVPRKSSEKAATRKVQDRKQRQVHHSVKKEKALSITQPIRKKTSNDTYHDFCYYICLLNRMARPKTPSASYRAYVGKGNNSILVKNSLKNRFWWVIVDADSEANLHWTQCKDSKFVQSLKPFKESESKKTEGEKTMKAVQFSLSKSDKEEGSSLKKLLSKDQKKKYTKGYTSVSVPSESNYRKLPKPNKIKMHNHLEFHWHISNKKALYYNLKKYYEAVDDNPFDYIPLTFHIQQEGDKEWQNFERTFRSRLEECGKKSLEKKRKKEKNLWIVKPGENSNQGCGIQVFDSLEEIREMMRYRETTKARSLIIQKYLMPFLYNKRKFDIRCYVLVTSVNSITKAYWYEEGYIRTSCKEFTTKNLKNRMVHLTNDAVQKKSEDYGKYENGNKVSFQDFQKYLDSTHPDKNYSFGDIQAGMIKRASDTIQSTCMLMDANRREFCFQIFGLDYMIDEDFNVWLIEVNTNPSLEVSSPLLARIIPNMIENALKIAVDPIFPPPKEYPKTKTLATDLFETNKFTLIFSSSDHEEMLASLAKDTDLLEMIESEEENHDEIQ